MLGPTQILRAGKLVTIKRVDTSDGRRHIGRLKMRYDHLVQRIKEYDDTGRPRPGYDVTEASALRWVFHKLSELDKFEKEQTKKEDTECTETSAATATD